MALVVNDYQDGFSFSGLTASSAGPFNILGGKYAFAVIDTGTADAQLTVLGPDGSTQIGYTAVTTTSVTNIDLPPGSYSVTLGTGTSLSASLIRIPYRAA